MPYPYKRSCACQTSVAVVAAKCFNASKSHASIATAGLVLHVAEIGWQGKRSGNPYSLLARVLTIIAPRTAVARGMQAP